MRTIVFGPAVVAGVAWLSMAPATAASPTMPGMSSSDVQVPTVETIFFRRRYYRQFGYPLPYGYYPLAGYYVPPAPYTYPPGYHSSPDDGYADAPPLDGYDTDAPPVDGGYADAPPVDGEWNDIPAEEGY